MSRLDDRPGTVGLSVPRASGDEPFRSQFRAALAVCSPRERG